MKSLSCILLTWLVAAPCIVASNRPAIDAHLIDDFYSFENDLQGWAVHGTNVNPGLPPPVTQSKEAAIDGATSLKFLVNRDDSFQFIWIEKVFEVAPNQVYDINIDYAFDTRDCCSNPFYVFTGALKKTPETPENFSSIAQDYADNKEDTIVGYKWIDKQFSFTARSDEQGKFHVIIGIYGPFPVRRIYYVDRVHVKMTQRTEPCAFYSFENDLEDWTPEGLDASGANGQPVDWSVTRSSQRSQDGDYSLRFFSSNSNEDAKVFIIRPFAVERKTSYRVSIEYEFLDFSITHGASLITGVLRNEPKVEDDLISFYQEKTQEPHGFLGWERKQYQFRIRSKKSHVLYVVVGIAANKSGHHLYFFDNVCVTLQTE